MTEGDSPRTISEELQIRFGANLRNARRLAGLTQGDLAGRTSANQAYISQVEKGLKNITLQSMTDMAQAVGVSVETLLISREGVPTLGNLEQVARAARDEIKRLRADGGDRPITTEMLVKVLQAVQAELHSSPEHDSEEK